MSTKEFVLAELRYKYMQHVLRTTALEGLLRDKGLITQKEIEIAVERLSEVEGIKEPLAIAKEEYTKLAELEAIKEKFDKEFSDIFDRYRKDKGEEDTCN